MTDTGMHVVLYGTLTHGYSVIGPFKTGVEAVDWASERLGDDYSNDWHAVPLESAEGYEDD